MIGVLLVLPHLVAGFLCFSAVRTRRATPAPSHRAALNRRWLLPPTALMLVAGARLVLPA
ncbi:hypothetical protein [Streptomyces sp. NPDC098101]|uniref:hypothetical protein n=1 Tax=Streptomyces sp. NPDC098101 TaxID=3366096 RepID=UPI003820EB77